MRLSLDALPFADNPALFGADRRPGLVSAIPEKDAMRCFWRREDAVEESIEPFTPFLWLAEPELLGGLEESRKPPEYELHELSGRSRFRFLVSSPTWNHLKRISGHVAKQSGLSANHPRSPQLFLSDPVQQYLMQSGRTMFNGMAFEDLRRMQIHVYAQPPEGLEYANSYRDPIVCLAMADSTGWRRLLTLDEMSEAELLEAFCRLVNERDPDVIEGHDLFKFHLDYLHQRARKLKVELRLGRDDAKLRYRRTRMFIAERTLDYQRWYVNGRDLVDSWILAQLFDVSGRELLSYDLGEVARHLRVGFPAPSAESLTERAERELDELAEVLTTLSYPYFLQAQIFPYRYEHVVLRGNATRINSLFLREYLRLKASVPGLPEAVEFAGGLTAQEHEGLVRQVCHCDVQSLYPSLILTYGLDPAGDSQGIFRRMLTDLREFRLTARDRQRAAESQEEARFYEALQTTFKILINSFYGYLGFAQGHFADFERAAEVTARGRQLLTTMMDWLRDKGCSILEVDTDGIYFVPPAGADGGELVSQLNATLPEGLQVDLDGCYAAMYCHRMKNYALLDYDGELTIRGSGLRSRSYEPYLREFLEQMLRLGLEGRGNELTALQERYLQALEEGTLPVDQLAKTETLIDSLGTYRRKIGEGSRNRAAVYEIALASNRPYVAGDSLSYYVTGEKASVTAYDHARPVSDFDPAQPDYNVAYYQKKLRDLFAKFQPALTSSTP